jgi:hypothetical protein
MRGWHRMLWDAGIPVDFIEVTELDEKYINEYKAIILPFPLSISEEVASKLEKYVLQGGNLISEACPGRLNAYGFANRGELSPVLRELFGVSQKSFKMVREPDGGKRWSPQERTWGEYLEAAMLEGTGVFEGMKLRANVYIETFDCKPDSTPILKYREAAAGSVRKAGGGKAWLIGTFAGHNGTAYRDAETRALILALLKECGIIPEYKGKLQLRKRVVANKSKEAWLFTNPTGGHITESIDVTGWSCVEDLMGNDIEVKDGFANLTVDGLDIRVLVVQK